MLGDHKRALEELEEKLKKAESVKEKLEKSKEEAIQALNDKVKTLQETHAEETQVLKTDKAKIVSEQEMLQGNSTFITGCLLMKWWKLNGSKGISSRIENFDEIGFLLA